MNISKEKALKNVVDDELKYQDYKKVWFNRSYTRHYIKII